MEGASRDSLPEGFDWDHLRSSEAAAEPGDQLRRTFGEAREEDHSTPPLSPPALLREARRLAVARRAREKVFGADLFSDPGWNILLELFIAGEEGRSITIKSACMAAGVPQSTALRYIAHLVEVGLCSRSQHPNDARSAHLRLTPRGRSKMAACLTLSAKDQGAPDA
jgi:DNA-binding MarR family transcriptional regulator